MITSIRVLTISAVVLDDVAYEVSRADRLHPNVPTELVRTTAIVAEEAGEALQAALDVTRGEVSREDALLGLAHLYNELCETASSAQRAMEVVLYARRAIEEEGVMLGNNQQAINEGGEKS